MLLKVSAYYLPKCSLKYTWQHIPLKSNCWYKFENCLSQSYYFHAIRDVKYAIHAIYNTQF